MSSGRASLVLLLASAILSHPTAAAAAPDDEACFSAAAAGQRARNDGHLLRARAELAVCASASCDAKVVQRCLAWLAEVNEAMPSLLFGAQDEGGHDLLDVRVLLDGAALAPAFSGMATPVDPGPHVVRFVKVGAPVVEQTVMVRERDKARLIRVVIPTATSEIAVARPVPPIVYGLGAVALAAAGVATYFAASGLNDRSSFGCSVSCTEEHAESVRRDLAIADVAGVAALAVVGAAVWLYVTRPSHREPVRVWTQPIPYGATSAVMARF